MSLVARMVNVITQVPRAPLRQLLIYYLILGAVGVLVTRFLPGLSAVLAGAGTAPDVLRTGINIIPALPLAMAGALAVSVPVSWAYMAVRERRGFDQSVSQTIVILPLVVAAIMMVIQHSLALAFALAGVAAAVRFRNTLKNVADATYVFLALGIGIAAGVGALGSAAVMSMMFSLASVVLWRCDFGRCPVPGEEDVAAADQKPARRGTLSVELADGNAQGVVEKILDRNLRKWRLVRTEAGPYGAVTLVYRVSTRKKVPPAKLVARVQKGGGGGIRGASFEERSTDPSA